MLTYDDRITVEGIDRRRRKVRYTRAQLDVVEFAEIANDLIDLFEESGHADD